MRSLLAAAAIALASFTAADAAAVRDGIGTLTYGNAWLSEDGYVGPTDLGFTVKFGDLNPRTQIYVNENGSVSLGDSEVRWVSRANGALENLRTYILAPFFSDVKRRNNLGGQTYGQGTVDGRNAFASTWRDVAGYQGDAALTNSFQVVLIDRSDRGAGQFDFEFNYDRIEWDVSNANGAKNGGTGIAAIAGYAGGRGEPGTIGTLPGSGIPGAMLDGGSDSLVFGSNVGVPGRWVFQVNGDGHVVEPTPAPIPLPAAAPMLLAGLGALSLLRRRRRA